MSEDPTRHLFEEKVLARLDAIDSRLASLEKRAHKRDFETKPIWENLLNAFTKMQAEVDAHLTNFDRKLDVVNKELLQVKADHSGLEKRLEKVEVEMRPDILVQDHQF
ncbi:MAG TPA: hypothetical protein VF791_15800 [Pyrinomonadaceae bacterium]